jgi:hypothetical protein
MANARLSQGRWRSRGDLAVAVGLCGGGVLRMPGAAGCLRDGLGNP